jgi:hypothetical protein
MVRFEDMRSPGRSANSASSPRVVTTPTADATTKRTGVRPKAIAPLTTGETTLVTIGAATLGPTTAGPTTTVRIKIADITPDRTMGGFTTTVGMETATTGGTVHVRIPAPMWFRTAIVPTVIARVGA